MKTYYINLEREHERRDLMERQLGALGLDYDRFPAIGVVDLDAAVVAKYCDPRLAELRTRTELACTISHQETMRRFLLSDDDYALILEDDAVLSKSLPAFLQEFEKRRPAWDITRLETFACPVVLWPPSETAFGSISILRPAGYVSGSAGYIVSKRGASIFAATGDLLARAIDWRMNSPDDPIHRRLVIRHTSPALVIQSDKLQAPGHRTAVSSLQSGRADRASMRRPAPLRRLPRRVGDALYSYLVARPRNALNRLAGARSTMVPFQPE